MGQLIESVGLEGEIIVSRKHNKLGEVIAVDKNNNQLVIETLVEGDTLRVNADECHIVEYDHIFKIYEATLKNGFVNLETKNREINSQMNKIQNLLDLYEGCYLKTDDNLILKFDSFDVDNDGVVLVKHLEYNQGLPFKMPFVGLTRLTETDLWCMAEKYIRGENA